MRMPLHRVAGYVAVVGATLALNACVVNRDDHDRPARVSVAPTYVVPAAPPTGPDRLVWTPGHWRWNGDRYVWEAGHYAERPNQTAQWEPGHWVDTGRGWSWMPGYWR